jgi:hypothetical protein
MESGEIIIYIPSWNEYLTGNGPGTICLYDVDVRSAVLVAVGCTHATQLIIFIGARILTYHIVYFASSLEIEILKKTGKARLKRTPRPSQNCNARVHFRLRPPSSTLSYCTRKERAGTN